MNNKTTTKTQITFVSTQDLKEKAMAKAKEDGITLKALFTMAMKSYVNNDLSIGLNVRDEYYDEVFTDKDVVKKANELGAALSKI